MAEKNTPTHPWFMERRYFSLTIILASVILSVIAFFICYQHHTINTEQKLKEDRSAVNLLSVVLDEHFKKIISVLESYSNRPLLLQAARDKNAEKAKVHLISLTKSDPDIDILIITDKQGTLWANYPERPEVLGKNFAYRDWYKDVSKEWKSSISDVYLRVVAEKDLAVSICAPLFNETGEVVGILVNTQRTVGLSSLLKRVLVDPDAVIMVADRKGQIVYSSQYDVEKVIRPYPFHSGMKKAAAAKNKTFTVDDSDLGGRTRYISFAPVVNIGWTVFVGRDRLSILLSGSSYYIQVTAIAFLLFLSIILFLFYSRKQVMANQILEQLQVEKKIRASEERYKSYIDVTLQLGWTTNDQGEIVEDNPSWSHYTGRDYEEFKGFGWIEDIHPDDRDHTKKKWDKAVAEKSFYETEYRIRRCDGVYRDYLARGIPLLDENGSVREWVGTCIDITDRKQIEEELHESERRLHEAQKMAQLGHWNWDVRTGKVEWSEEVFNIFQLDPKEFSPHIDSILALSPWPEDHERDKELIRKAMETHEKGTYEQRFLRPDNSIGYYHSTFQGKYDDGGNLISIVGTVQDITERKRAEEEIKKLNAELEQRVIDRTTQLSAANKELSAFSYSVSHDLRAPLRSIDGFSQALLEEYQDKPLDDTGKTYLERVRKATHHMGKLIDDMLKLSRITQVEFKREAVDLSGLIKEITEAHQSNPDKIVDVTVQEGIMVQSDPFLMKIAIENLVDNAFKFTGKEAHPRIEFGTVVREGKTACFIRDNGAGFEMAYVGKLFGAFQRLHTVDEFPGTGIGLATVQRIINRHGGQIWAEAEKGKGATFYFTLPS